MAYTTEQMCEYQRKRLGFNPRANCPHGEKRKVDCLQCRRDADNKRTQRYRTDPTYRERRRESVRNSVRKRTLPVPTRVCPERCECCGGLPNGKKSLALDHCHFTGVFRGWLCIRCNRAIGMLGDTLESVRKAVAYLERV
jgi:Recombination endonuclease VII